MYKVDGCDSMTCGRDASDKGGGNKQDGCGKGFRWPSAKPYKRASEEARLPKTLADVDPDRARETVHHLFAAAPGAPALERQSTAEYRIKCEVLRPSASPIHLAPSK